MLQKKDVKSEVEFYLVDAFEIYHYLPIYYELIKRGVNTKIISEPCSINIGGGYFDYNTAIKILEENNIDYSTECNPDTCVSITTQRSNILKKYKNTKIHLSYGVSLIKSIFSLSNESCFGFDARILHGLFSQKNLIPYMDRDVLYPIGYPKHDSYFKNKPEKNVLLHQLDIATNKPILVYLPTYDEDTSIQLFGNEIGVLRDKFYILTKPHHCTARLPEKSYDLERLYAISDKVLDGNASFTDICSCADFYITDAKSGASLESLYINSKPAVFLTPRNGPALKQFYPELFEIAPVINAKNHLSTYIEKFFENTFPVTTVDIEYFLGKRDGHSSERAANVIMKYCQASPKNKISIAKKCNTADTMTPIQHSACNAISWLHTHSSNGGANVSHKNTVPYPEVTGYLIPTLLKWNQPQLAMCYARWLLTVQNADGSFSGPGMTTPFAFDTGQIIRGLAAIVPSLPEAEVALEKACDWIMRTATPEGRLALPENMNGWRLPDGRGFVNEAIHLYVLPGLVTAGDVLNKPEYAHFARCSLDYYITHCNLTNFLAPNMLLHFYCYIQEALFDLGADDICRLGMRVLEDIQGDNGLIPAYANVSWICTPGLIQSALVWLKLKDMEHALPALRLAGSLQTASGGFPGSVGNGAMYFPDEELSWAAKFWLDALQHYEQYDVPLDQSDSVAVYGEEVRIFSEKEIPIISLEQAAIKHLESEKRMAAQYDSPATAESELDSVPTLLDWGRRAEALALVKHALSAMDATTWDAPEKLFLQGDLIRVFRQPEVRMMQGDAPLKELCLNVFRRQRQTVHEAPGLFYCFNELLHAGMTLGEKSWADCARSWATRQGGLPDQPPSIHLILESVGVGQLLTPANGVALLRKVAAGIGLPPQAGHMQKTYASLSLALAWGAWTLGDDELGQSAFCRAVAALADGNSKALQSDIFDALTAKAFLDALSAMQRCRFALEFPLFQDDIASDDGRLLFVRDTLPCSPEARILDIGTAKGRYLRRLRAMGITAHMTAQDVHPSFFRFMPKGVATGIGTVLRTGWDDAAFDAVTLCEVLEHCIDLPAAVRELSRILSDGGKLIIIDKNIDRLAAWPGGIPPWEQWFDREALADLLNNNGFTVENIAADLPYENRRDGLFFGLAATRKKV